MFRHEHVQLNENLVSYTFPLFEAYPDLACVVSTRLGGVSTGYLRSLNLSFRTGDTEEAVIENRARLYRILADILVGISPRIGPCCYQVREDLVAIFTQAFPQEASRLFIPQPDDTLHLDMWAALRWQFLAVGIFPEHLEIAEICTACHTDEFYSHRAEHGNTGRFASVIVLRA